MSDRRATVGWVEGQGQADARAAYALRARHRAVLSIESSLRAELAGPAQIGEESLRRALDRLVEARRSCREAAEALEAIHGLPPQQPIGRRPYERRPPAPRRPIDDARAAIDRMRGG